MGGVPGLGQHTDSVLAVSRAIGLAASLAGIAASARAQHLIKHGERGTRLQYLATPFELFEHYRT